MLRCSIFTGNSVNQQRCRIPGTAAAAAFIPVIIRTRIRPIRGIQRGSVKTFECLNKLPTIIIRIEIERNYLAVIIHIQDRGAVAQHFCCVRITSRSVIREVEPHGGAGGSAARFICIRDCYFAAGKRGSFHAVIIVVVLRGVRHSYRVGCLLLPENDRVLRVDRCPLCIKVLMSCQHGAPTKGVVARLVGVPSVKAIADTGGIGRLHSRSGLIFFHSRRRRVGSSAAVTAVVLMEINPVRLRNDGVQQNVAVCHGNGINRSRASISGGPALEGLRVQLWNDGNVCRIHNLGSFARFEQNFFNLNGLAVLTVERYIIGRNDLRMRFDRFRLSRLNGAADHNLLIRFVKPAVERCIGLKRGNAGILDHAAVLKDLGVEQRIADIELVRNRDAGLIVIILYRNQNIHGEGTGGEGDFAAYRLERTDAVAVRDSVVIDLDRSGIAAVQTNSDLNALLKRPFRAFAVDDLNIVGSEHSLACSLGAVGGGCHLRADCSAAYRRDGHAAADRKITGNRNFTG